MPNRTPKPKLDKTAVNKGDQNPGIAFYKRAFGAVELFRMAHPNGNILHAEVSIAGSVFMIGDPDNKLYSEPRALGRCAAGLHIFVDDDAAEMERREKEFLGQ